MKPADEIARETWAACESPLTHDGTGFATPEQQWEATRIACIGVIAAAITQARAEGARDMRERAAHLVDQQSGLGTVRRRISHAIRALPDSPEGGA